MKPCWRYEWRLLFLISTLGLLSGWLLGHLLLGVLGILLVYLLWQAYALWRFFRWIYHGDPDTPPALGGVWAALVERFRLQNDSFHRKERRLRDLLQRYQATAAAVPDGIVVLQPDYTIDWMNGAAAAFLGLKPEEDAGQRIENLVRQPKFIDYLHGGDYSQPLALSCQPRGEGVLELHIVRYGQGQLLLVIRDVTRLQRLEAMRRDFVANVSHELRTPLTVISGYLEALQEGVGPSSLQHTALSTMSQQAERMMHLVDDLLLISKLETGVWPAEETLVKVPHLLQTLMREARLLGGDKVQKISLDVDEGLFLHGHERQLYSAFLNLVSNAVQYTPAGGEISLRWYRDQQGAHFAVQDSGIGIARQDIPRLTERFYRVDRGRSRAVGGTGLGLAIVKHVLNLHQAVLQINSTLGQGSLFRCDFPIDRIVCIDEQDKVS